MAVKLDLFCCQTSISSKLIFVLLLTQYDYHNYHHLKNNRKSKLKMLRNLDTNLHYVTDKFK